MTVINSVAFPRAFVQAVTVSQYASSPGTPTPVYAASWPLIPPATPTITMDSSGRPVSLLAEAPTPTLNQPALTGLATRFDFHFNNLMNPTAVPTIQVNLLQNGKNIGAPYLLTGSWGTDKQTYSVEEPASFLADLTAGAKVSLSVSGAQDAKNLPMDGDPKTIAAAHILSQLALGSELFHAEDMGWIIK